MASAPTPARVLVRVNAPGVLWLITLAAVLVGGIVLGGQFGALAMVLIVAMIALFISAGRTPRPNGAVDGAALGDAVLALRRELETAERCDRLDSAFRDLVEAEREIDARVEREARHVDRFARVTFGEDAWCTALAAGREHNERMFEELRQDRTLAGQLTAAEHERLAVVSPAAADALSDLARREHDSVAHGLTFCALFNVLTCRLIWAPWRRRQLRAWRREWRRFQEAALAILQEEAAAYRRFAAALAQT